MDALSKIFEDIHLNKSEYIYLNLSGDWAFRYQEQGAIAAYIVLQGKIHLQLDDGQKRLIEAGDLVLIPSGQSHYGCSDQEKTLLEATDISTLFDEKRHKTIELGNTALQENNCFIIAVRGHIDSIMARPLFNALPAFMHIHHITGSSAPEWLQTGLHFLAIEAHQIRPGRDKILDHLVSILMIQCVRDFITQLNDAGNWLNALTHPELSSALAAIHGQPEKAWTVESLAEQCCMSRSKFAGLFSQIIGETPLAYLQQHRLRLASQMLRQGQLSIQQIAHKVGYSSETAFSQTFKKQTTLTPTQYRQHHQS